MRIIYPLAISNACTFHSPVNKIMSIGNSVTCNIDLFNTQITASLYLL